MIEGGALDLTTEKQIRVGDKFYVSNPKGLNVELENGPPGAKFNLPQRRRLEVISINRQTVRLMVVDGDSGAFNINDAKLQHSCKPERRFDGFSDPISQERTNELLTKHNCPFRKNDTPSNARDLMIRATQYKLQKVIDDFFHTKIKF